MRRVFQTIIDPEHGDCYRAAIASALDMDLEDVPDAKGQEFPLIDWLPTVGICAIHLDATSRLKERGTYAGKTWDARNFVRYDLAEGAVAVASVPSQKYPGGWHAIVVGFMSHREYPGAVEVRCLHDPNPGNEPYDMEATEIRQLTFFLPRLAGPDSKRTK